MLHFFVCKEPEKANWLGMIRFHREFKDRGLVILAVTPDPPDAVATMLQDYPLPFVIGAGSDMAKRWKMGTYGQVLIDARGEEFYRVGASNGVWNGKLRKAINGSRPIGIKAALQVNPSIESTRITKRILAALSKGELAKAVGYCEPLLARPDAEANQISELLGEIEQHLKRVNDQLSDLLKGGQASQAQAVVDGLCKELKRHPWGEPFRKLAEDLQDDENHQMELAAEAAYDRLIESFFKMGFEKNRKKLEALVGEYPDSHTSRWVNAYWLGLLWK